MRFEKWQALGNDYLVIEAANLPWELTAARIQRLCEAHFGVGSDGILLLSRPESDDRVADLRIFNPDGSEAELSGNGAREAIMYLRRAGWTDRDSFTIGSPAGPLRPRIIDERTCEVEMGRATLQSRDFPDGPADGRAELSADGREWAFTHVSIGNPQCAIAVADGLEDLPLEQIGPGIVNHPSFPNRTNVSFYSARGSTVRARIFERGVGETLSSGTGATGAAVAAYLDGAESPVTIELDGGELAVEISPQLDVRLRGWAVPVYAGELSRDFTEELSQLS